MLIPPDKKTTDDPADEPVHRPAFSPSHYASQYDSASSPTTHVRRSSLDPLLPPSYATATTYTHTDSSRATARAGRRFFAAAWRAVVLLLLAAVVAALVAAPWISRRIPVRRSWDPKWVSPSLALLINDHLHAPP